MNIPHGYCHCGCGEKPREELLKFADWVYKTYGNKGESDGASPIPNQMS